MDARAWDERYAGAELLWSVEPNRFLVEEVAGLVPGRALDLACGEGRNAIWLARQGWQVVAVDFSSVALDKARRLAAAQHVTVEWRLADVVTAPLEPRSYDLVVVLYLHLPAAPRRAVLTAAAGALSPGGTLLVVGHDLTNLTDGHGGPQDPTVLYGPEDIAADLPGLDLVRAERVQRPVATDGGEVQAVDALVRAVYGQHP